MGIPLPAVTTWYFPYSSSTHPSLSVQSEQEPHKGGGTPLCLHHFAPTYALILKQELCSCEVPSVHTANHVVPPCLACRRWGPSRPQSPALAGSEAGTVCFPHSCRPPLAYALLTLCSSQKIGKLQLNISKSNCFMSVCSKSFIRTWVVWSL